MTSRVGARKPTDAEIEELIDIEQLLVNAFEDAWGSSPKVEKATSARARLAMAPTPEVQSEDPPSEPEPKQDSQGEGEAETEINEMDLRKMTAAQLRKFCKDNDMASPPDFLRNRDGIVDWMMSQAE
jgi:hypothetical protein